MICNPHRTMGFRDRGRRVDRREGRRAAQFPALPCRGGKHGECRRRSERYTGGDRCVSFYSRRTLDLTFIRVARRGVTQSRYANRSASDASGRISVTVENHFSTRGTVARMCPVRRLRSAAEKGDDGCSVQREAHCRCRHARYVGTSVRLRNANYGAY